MNYLEEIVLSRNLPEFDRSRIEKQLAPVIPDQQQLLSQSGSLAKEVERHISRDQVSTIDEIYRHNAQLVKPNETALHECLNKEKEYAAKLDKARYNKNGLGEAKTSKQLSAQIDSLRLKTIDELEHMDFIQISKITKINEVWGPSFHKVWTWVLEVYFGFPSSKYSWEDFSKKTMSKSCDSGKELKRRMIVLEPTSMTPFQLQELEDIVASHRKLLMDKTNFPEFNKFLDVLSLIYQQSRLQKERHEQETSGRDSSDAMKMREEEERTLMAGQKLNQTRFDLISEVQNLYLLIDAELK
jgi:hypothetical protein